MSFPRKYRTLVLALSSLFAMGAAQAQAEADRTGKEVYEGVCAACHDAGKDKAPKMSDRAEWRKRASHGLIPLAEHAISGYRRMPAHGNQASLSDLEISRGVAYMVSGGFAADLNRSISSPVRVNGEALVASRCIECHGAGANKGAPRIGEVADWQPRLQKGVDRLVKSAIRGHNKMPARAGMASLSDNEVRGAVVYMVVHLKPPAQSQSPAPAHNHAH